MRSNSEREREREDGRFGWKRVVVKGLGKGLKEGDETGRKKKLNVEKMKEDSRKNYSVLNISYPVVLDF